MDRNKKAWWLIIIASLGYFVDLFDLLLFQVVKKASLTDIGVSPDHLFDFETALFNYQMTGMLIGGLVWGIMGDKLGRIQVLFGSIIMYSLANIANAFVTTTEMYKLCRIIAGIGLAGELGAGITLVVETMDKKKRGYGTMIIVTFGALGAVTASLVGGETGGKLAAWLGLNLKSWQMTYIIGGVLGLLLLALRAGAYESGMFSDMKHNREIVRGNFFQLFDSSSRFYKYIMCIAIGLPIWFIIGVIIANAEKYAVKIGVPGKIQIGPAIMYSYIGLSFGDLISGLLSQWLGSRKKVVVIYITTLTLSMFVFLNLKNVSVDFFYFMCFVLGTSTGYWAIFVTIAAEQFGTNIRSTVTNTVPNFVRGATVLMTLGFKGLYTSFGETPDVIVLPTLLVGLTVIVIALVSIFKLKEAFSKELDYFEE